MDTSDKGKPDESQGRKATGPRFLREAMDDLPKDPKIAGLPFVIRFVCIRGSEHMQLSSALFSTGEPAYAVDRDGIIRAWNHAAEDAFGYSQSDAVNRRCWELLTGQDLFGNRYCCKGCPLREIAFNHKSVNSNEMRFVTADKKLKQFRITRLLIACDAENEVLVHLCRPPDKTGDGSNNIAATRKPVTLQRGGTITTREMDILALLADGNSTRQIATELSISPATVRNHIQNLFYKLGVHNRVAAVRRGRECGLI